MISYTASRNPPQPIERRIFIDDIGLGIVGCICHLVRERVTIAHIQSTVAGHFGIPAYEMRSQRRERAVARPRQIAMLLAKELTGKSLPDIGRCFGNRDHTTVMHAIRTVKALCGKDDAMAESVNSLRTRLSPKFIENPTISKSLGAENAIEQSMKMQTESVAA